MISEVARAEWNNWQAICHQLKALGAVTDDDLTSAVPSMETPGQELFTAIRKWGDSLVTLKRESDSIV